MTLSRACLLPALTEVRSPWPRTEPQGVPSPQVAITGKGGTQLTFGMVSAIAWRARASVSMESSSIGRTGRVVNAISPACAAGIAGRTGGPGTRGIAERVLRPAGGAD